MDQIPSHELVQMRTPRLVLAAIVALIGLFWIGQGSGMIGGSAMSGSFFWEIIGAVLVVVGIAIAATEWIRRSRTTP